MSKPWYTQPARLRLVSVSAIALMAMMAVAAQAGGEHGAHGDPLALNWWDGNGHNPPIGYFLVDFFIFISGLVYVAAKPLSQAFAQRHLSIKRAISEASAAHAKATARQKEASGKLSLVDAEVRALAESSKIDGEAERAAIVHEAQEYAERLQSESGSIAAQELQRAQGRLRRTLLSAALRQARTRLLQDITEADKQRLLEQAIGELDQAPGADVSRARKNSNRATGSGGVA